MEFLHDSQPMKLSLQLLTKEGLDAEFYEGGNGIVKRFD